MDWNDIPVFVRVVERGGFTAAARELGMQKSAVSRSISKLEQELGVRLLQRTTRKLAVTDAGQALFEQVRGSVTGLAEAIECVREAGGEPRGVVRMTAPPDIQYFGLTEALASFTQKYPAIHLDLMLTQRTVDLVGEGIDLAIRAGKLSDSSLIVRRIGESPLALFAAPEYLERTSVPETLQDLRDHQCILFRAQHGKARWSLTGPHGEESVEVTGAINADEMGFIASAAVAGLGIAQLPAPLAMAPTRRNHLKWVLPDYQLKGAAVSVVLPSSAFVPSRVALLRDHLVNTLYSMFAHTMKDCERAKLSADKRCPE